nr:MAG TPA: hypothetical protein [Caudoviricetes sp.]
MYRKSRDRHRLMFVICAYKKRIFQKMMYLCNRIDSI